MLTVGTTRPYPYAGPPEQWRKVQAEWVDWSEVTTTQDGVYIDALLRPADVTADYPYVVVFEGRAYLEDGHTRVCRSILHGYSGGLCRVLKL